MRPGVLFSDPVLSATSASSAVTFCPQAVSTAERAESWGERMEPMRAQMLVLGAIGRRSRAHHVAVECCSVTLLSLRPLRALRSPRSHVANDNRSLPQAVSTAERAELWGEGHGADEGAGLVSWRHQATFIGSVVSSSHVAQRLPLRSASSARSAVIDGRGSQHGRVSPPQRTGGRSRAPTVLVEGARGAVAWVDSERNTDREVVHAW